MSFMSIGFVSTRISFNALTNLICEEADCLKSRQTHGQLGQGGKNSSTTDKALAATSFNAGKKKCCKGNCHNCGKPGHWAREYCSLKKDKKEDMIALQSSKPKKKPVGSANVVMHKEEEDGFWMVTDEAVNLTHLVSKEPDLLLGKHDNIDDALHWKGENDTS